MGNSGCFLWCWGVPKVLERWCWSPLFPGPGSGGWHLLLKAGRRGLSAVVEECLFCRIILIKADFGQAKRVNPLPSLQHMLWEASSPQKVRLSTMPCLWKAGAPAALTVPLLDGETLFTKPKSEREKEVTYIHHKSSGSAHNLTWKHNPVPWQAMKGWGFRGDSELLGSSTLSLQLLLPIPLFLILFVDPRLELPGGHHRQILAWADPHVLQ